LTDRIEFADRAIGLLSAGREAELLRAGLSERFAGAAGLRGPSTSYVEGPLPMLIVADEPASIADNTPSRTFGKFSVECGDK
jgi:hypothetical protein